MRRLIALLPLLLLAGCSRGAAGESDASETANRAKALQRTADATTDELINQINAEASLQEAQLSGSSGSAGNNAAKK
jgi:hypothetical protein